MFGVKNGDVYFEFPFSHSLLEWRKLRVLSKGKRNSVFCVGRVCSRIFLYFRTALSHLYSYLKLLMQFSVHEDRGSLSEVSNPY